MNTSAASTSRQQHITLAISAIEHELRALGVWQDAPPPAERLEFAAAFGADKLSFYEWLQWVLLARVRSILADGGEFPRGSAVGTYAVRELDGYPGAEALVERLCEFDRLFAAADEAPEPAIDESHGPERTVRAFLIAMQVGNAAAARAQLTPPQRDDAAFAPAPPFPIEDFQVQPAQQHGDCAVVHCDIRGIGADGGPAQQSMPFVLVESDGDWRIDLSRSVAMLLTGDPHGGSGAVEASVEQAVQGVAEGLTAAMQGVAAALASAFGEEAGFGDALMQFQQDALPRHQQALVERLGTPLQLRLEPEGMAKHLRTVRELDDFLAGDFYTAVAMMTSSALLVLREGLRRIVISFAPQRSARGVFRRGDELRIVLHPELQAEFRSSTSLCRVLELSVHPELAAEYEHANARLGHWQQLLLDRHGLDLAFRVGWLRFTAAHDMLTNAWSLHLLAEQGIDPLGAALDTVLREHPDLAANARSWLRELRIDRVDTPAQRSVLRFDQETLQVELHVAEDFADYWTSTELQDRLLLALGGASA